MGSHWILSDSQLGASGNEIFINTKSLQSSKFNGLWKEPLNRGVSPATPAPQYYEIKVKNAGEGVWCGVVPETQFGAGWKCNGFQFGGNTSDGGSLKRQAFGPRPKDEDTIGMRAEVVNGNKLDVRFSLNGIGLGCAFLIAGADSVGPVFPMISFSGGPARASIIRSSPPPAETMDVQPEGARTSVGGDWSVCSSAFISGGVPKDSDLGGDGELFQVALHIDTEQWGLSAHVANSCSVQLSPNAPHKVAGGVRMTMMMAPPPLQPLEAAVSAALSDITDISLEGNELKVSYCDNKFFFAVPTQKRHDPVDRDEIGWLHN